MKFLVDANILSEPTKPAPDDRVLAWLGNNDSQLATSSVVMGELEYGILLLPAGRRRTRLQHWFAEGARRIRVLDFDANCASAWAGMIARMKKKGLAMPIKDSLIAATALSHGLVVATRNTGDYRHAGVALVNPFEA